MRCIRCQREIDENSRFCPFCGSSQAPTCPQCGSQVAINQAFCSQCGAKLLTSAQEPPESTGAPAEALRATAGGTESTRVTVGVWIRFVALAIDCIILYIVSYFIAKPFGSATTSLSGGFNTGFSLGGTLAGVVILLYLIYFVVLEGTVGATFGKIVLGLRVVRKDGSRCGIVAALIRNILRVIDAMPYVIPYLVGAILVRKSPHNQRLGDRVANTLVVRSQTR